MSDHDVKKIAASAGVIACTLMVFGSWLGGTRVLVGLIRGVEGFVVFGSLGWIVGKWLQARGGLKEAVMPPEDDESKGTHLDETA